MRSLDVVCWIWWSWCIYNKLELYSQKQCWHTMWLCFLCVLTGTMLWPQFVTSMDVISNWFVFPLSNISLLITAVLLCSVKREWRIESGPLLTQVQSTQTDEMQPCSLCSGVFGSWPRHVKFNFCLSTESQQAACLERIKSPASVSLLILGSDVKTNKWQRFMSEVNWQLFSVPPGLSVPGVYDDAALRLDPVRKHGIYVILWYNRTVGLTENTSIWIYIYIYMCIDIYINI